MHDYAPLGETAEALPEARLRRRLAALIQAFAEQPESSIPQAAGNRNDMDAAYAFFDNRRVRPPSVVAACLPDTRAHLGGCPRVLAVQDTSDLNYSSLDATDGLGYTDGHATRGLKHHATLAVRPDGLPAGLLTQQIWARDPRTKGKAPSRRGRDAADKESYRWLDHAHAARAAVPADVTVVHVADREGDVYDWFAAGRPANTHLLVRVAQARRVVAAGPDGAVGYLADVARAAPVLGRHTIAVPRADDQPSRAAVLTLRVAAVRIQPPHNARKRAQLPAVPAWVIEAVEEDPPAGEKAICWRLATTEPVETLAEAVRALQEYVLRWLIERFHYVLKSGCGVERLQLETADRLANAVSVYAQVAARVLRLTYRRRVEPAAEATAEFSVEELAVLGQAASRRSRRPVPVGTLAEAVSALGRLGGHLGRTGDGPPGAKVLWRGLRCLHDLVLGYRIGRNTNSPPTQPDTRNG